MNLCWSELYFVLMYLGLHCASACSMWFYQRVDLLHVGHRHILEQRVQSSKLLEYLYIDICVTRYHKNHRIRTSDIEQITRYRYLCVGGHQTDHRTDCWIQWTNLTISYSGQVRLVSLLYHCIMRAYQLIIIIIFSCKINLLS